MVGTGTGGGGSRALGAKKVGDTVNAPPPNPPNIDKKLRRAELATGTVVVIQAGSVGGRLA